MIHRFLACVLALACITAPFAATVKDLNTPRVFPEVESKDQWLAMAQDIRENILVSCGLWPMPPKTPLNGRVFGRVERDGYSVEKVYFETYPGFFLAGNLYRPLGQAEGPFPGILNPHGHWTQGRMADSELGSIAARCINFARQGMVAFSYDMVGYNDTRQVDHKFASGPANQLWSISLMGLQTWNSIRALDFLESLPDVDKKRLACTGASGGGTQTFMLGAVDPRLAAQAPAVMVSHSMQGGCLCENAPGLRVDYSNMEIAAVPAPRPQILVAATGDWTAKTMSVEGPAIERIYRLFNAADQFEYTIFDYPHNYNQTSREAVYAWFGKHLLGETDPAKLKEHPFTKEPTADLLVFPEELPEGALNEAELIASLIDLAKDQLSDLAPRDEASLRRWKDTMRPAWKHALQLRVSGPGIQNTSSEERDGLVRSIQRAILQRARGEGTIECAALIPRKESGDYIAILVHPDGLQAVSERVPITAALLAKGIPVAGAGLFLTGGANNPELSAKRDYFQNYFTGYNRTDAQQRVSDLAQLIAVIREKHPEKKVVLVGEGTGGLWAVLASPLADAVIADMAQFDSSKTENLLHRGIFFPGFLKIGGFPGILALAAPNPVLIHNVQATDEEHAAYTSLHQAYESIYGEGQRCAAGHREKKSPEAIANWVAGLSAL